MLANTVYGWILCALAAYLLGSFNGAMTISKLFFKTDIRALGSGNAGTTNALRTLGFKAALPVAAIDGLKAIAALWLGMWLIGDIAIIVAGTGVVIGHAYPVYYGFRGGKCVMCGSVIAAFIDWRVLILALTVFAAVILASRLVALASMLAAVAAIPATAYFRGGAPYIVFVAALTVFLIYLHRSNVKRIIDKTEPKLGSKEA